MVSALLGNYKKFVRGCTKGFAVHPSLDLAPCIAVPEGHGFRRDVPASRLERGWLARRQREEKCSRGRLPSPLARYARERTQANQSRKMW